MIIWFDLSNSPHINMFYDLIKDLETNGHEIIITSRPLANTVDLLNQKGLKHTIIGSHYGKNIYKKLFGYPIRVLQLVKFLKNKKIDLAVSQSSFHSPIVAKILGFPSIYTNDNEHAIGNKPSFIFATRILIPENLLIKKVSKIGVSTKKIVQYPGLKEGIYLWRKGEHIHSDRLNNKHTSIKIFIRPEPQTAQYYNGKKYFLDEMIIALQQKYNVTVLPRDTNQSNYYNQSKFYLTNVPDKPLGFDQIATNCTLFIGAGGSMTREIAILGIPTISVYQDTLLDVDQYLLSSGLMSHEPFLTASITENYIQNLQNKNPSLALMQKGKLAYELFLSEIQKFNKL